MAERRGMRYCGVLWLGCLLGLYLQQAGAQSLITAYPYRNPALPAEKRVNDLLRRMTTEEKIGQMLQLCASSITLNGTKELDLDSARIRYYIRNHHVGSFLSGTGSADRWVRFTTQMQRIAVEETRLGIPIIFGIDHVHGANYVNEGTLFPHQLSLGCSFDTSLAALVAAATARETAPLGMPWNFAPVLDVGKNPFWPRHYETFGEDPLLCGQMGSTFVKTYQHAGQYTPYRLAACAKHFIGYSDPRSGWDRAPSEIPPQAIQEYFIPPFRAAIEAGVKTLMVNSGELNGEPVHGSRYWLTSVLRQQLGFKGVVVTDIKDIVKMVTMHRAAASEEEATLRALQAGIDVHMACDAVSFSAIVRQLLQEKKISMARIDSSVRRILQLKFELGLFEYPYASEAAWKQVPLAEHRRLATRVAAQSIVLLKNENQLLPIARPKKILVAGFAAHLKKPLTGPWTLEWQGAEEARQPTGMLTLAGALQQAFGPSTVQVLQTGDTIQPAEMQKLRTMAAEAEVIVLTIGEKPYSEFKGNDHSLELEASQQEMVKVAHASGKPVVLVLIEGRPRTIREVEPLASAILFAGYPGAGGGEALAQIISGAVNPSGKLSFSYPLEQGHFVPYYHKQAEVAHLPPARALWQYPFGHGLSYTEFSYDSMQLSDTVLRRSDSPLAVSVTVKNTGNRAGTETVLLFVADEAGYITRPVRQLKAFAKVYLQPGESRKVVLRLQPSDLMYPDASGIMQWEPGWITLEAGRTTRRIKCL